MNRNRLALFILILGLQACITAPEPLDEFLYARTAMDAAKSVDAARYASGYWHQAEEAYRKAQILYQEREYETAKIEFIKAKIAAEKAENSARVQRFKNGDVL